MSTKESVTASNKPLLANTQAKLLVAVITISIALSASITALAVHYLNEANGDSARISQLTTLIEKQAELLELHDIRLAELSVRASTQDSTLSSDTHSALQQLLIEQERSKQQQLETTRAAIYDLAQLVPGSKSWLNMYSAKLDEAIRQSQLREKILTRVDGQ